MKTKKDFLKMWPDMFDQEDNSNFFCLPQGWTGLVWGLCLEIEQELQGDFEGFKIVQIKEKFGALRFYVSTNGKSNSISSVISDMIAEAELLSSKICIRCGTTDGVTTEGQVRVITLCPQHREVMNDKSYLT